MYFPGTEYTINVFSTSFGVISIQPRSKEIKTPPLSPVGPFTITNISSTTVTVTWQRPAGNLDYFEVMLDCNFLV